MDIRNIRIEKIVGPQKLPEKFPPKNTEVGQYSINKKKDQQTVHDLGEDTVIISKEGMDKLNEITDSKK